MIMVEEVGVPASMAGLGEEPSVSLTVAANLIAGAVSRLEIRNAYSKPVVYTSDDIRKALLEPAKPRTPGSKTIMERVKPTLIIDFKAGAQKTIAPYGVADPEEWKKNTTIAVVGILALWAGLVGVGYYWGRRSR